MVRICDLPELHFGSLLRSSLISKWLNIVSKQTLASGKFLYPTPSNQLVLHSPDQSGKGQEHHLHWKPGIGILFCKLQRYCDTVQDLKLWQDRKCPRNWVVLQLLQSCDWTLPMDTKPISVIFLLCCTIYHFKGYWIFSEICYI